MDWSTRLRRALNREDYLSGWRLALMRIVDPVEWYMRRHDEENGRPVSPPDRRHRPVGWTAYAPMEEEAPISNGIG